MKKTQTKLQFCTEETNKKRERERTETLWWDTELTLLAGATAALKAAHGQLAHNAEERADY